MSTDTSAKGVPSEGSFHSDKNESKATESKKSHPRNPPELNRNEAAARSKPVKQLFNETYDNIDEENDAQQPIEDEDDPCVKKHTELKKVDVGKTFRRTPGLDPRFQQQNQTLRCFVMYTDFYRCEKILGEGHEACTWFRDVFTSICPKAWVTHWDELRSEGRMPWSRSKTQGDFPGDRYGV